jgi:hypothetical protein
MIRIARLGKSRALSTEGICAAAGAIRAGRRLADAQIPSNQAIGALRLPMRKV